MQNEFRRPEIITDINHTELKVWNIDLADSYPDLSMDEKSILRHIVKSGLAQSVNMVKKALGITEYRARKAIEVQLQMAMEILKKQVT